MRFKKALICIVMLSVSGCAQTQYVATSKPLRRSVTPVCISKDDGLTEPTARQIEANNLALRSLNKSHDECKASKPTS